MTKKTDVLIDVYFMVVVGFLEKRKAFGGALGVMGHVCNQPLHTGEKQTPMSATFDIQELHQSTKETSDPKARALEAERGNSNVGE